MPKLWTDNLEAHRSIVQRAVRSAAVDLVAERGLRAVTMSAIAERSGIGRATLYRYFPDVEAILLAWHLGEVRNHLDELSEIAAGELAAAERLHRVLERYALRLYGSGRHAGGDVAALLHRDPGLAAAHADLVALLERLVQEAAAQGSVRRDIASSELVAYALGAVSAARTAPSAAAVRRLARLVVGGLT